MCGRFVSSSTADEIASYFDADAPDEDLLIERSWNVAPTDDIYVVLEDVGVRRVGVHHWGLVPFWAKDPKIASRMINARAEGIAEKNAFKYAFERRRCIIPATGFYEWKKPAQDSKGAKKQPYFIHRADHEPIAFAGLWEEWKGQLRSATIITTEANETMRPIHDRMPVILPRSAWDRWLSTDPSFRTDLGDLSELLGPASNDLLVMHAVGTEVGNVRNQGPQLIEAIPPLAVDVGQERPTG